MINQKNLEYLYQSIETYIESSDHDVLIWLKNIDTKNILIKKQRVLKAFCNAVERLNITDKDLLGYITDQKDQEQQLFLVGYYKNLLKSQNPTKYDIAIRLLENTSKSNTSYFENDFILYLLESTKTMEYPQSALLYKIAIPLLPKIIGKDTIDLITLQVIPWINEPTKLDDSIIILKLLSLKNGREIFGADEFIKATELLLQNNNLKVKLVLHLLAENFKILKFDHRRKFIKLITSYISSSIPTEVKLEILYCVDILIESVFGNELLNNHITKLAVTSSNSAISNECIKILKKHKIKLSWNNEDKIKEKFGASFFNNTESD